MAYAGKATTQVRPAIKADCGEIARLIKELAVYEKIGDQVKMTRESLEEDGFGDEKFYHCLVADNPNYTETNLDSPKLIGYALYFFTYSTFEGRCVYMEDLYVAPEFRKQGIGKRLMKGVAQVAVDKRCARFGFSVLNWNTPSIAFYKSLGAVDLTEKEGWHLFRLNRTELETFANA